MSKEKQIEKVYCDIECDEKFACFVEEPKVYESDEEHFNDIFAGYESDHQKALALIAWQGEQIKNLETAIKVYRSCLEQNNLDPKLYDAGYRKQSEGEWVMSEWDDNAACSLCGCEPYDFKTPEREPEIAQYCPGCGAKMRGVNFGESITWDKLKDMKAWNRAVEWAESQGVCRFCDHLPKCRKYQDDQVPINAPCMVKKRDYLEFDKSEAPNAEQR